MPVMVRRGDEDTNRKEAYSLDAPRVLQMLDRCWMPLPLLREELARRLLPRPDQLGALPVSQLDQPDQDGNEYRLVLALDTG